MEAELEIEMLPVRRANRLGVRPPCGVRGKRSRSDSTRYAHWYFPAAIESSTI